MFYQFCLKADSIQNWKKFFPSEIMVLSYSIYLTSIIYYLLLPLLSYLYYLTSIITSITNYLTLFLSFLTSIS